jgi:hypothetical protein
MHVCRGAQKMPFPQSFPAGKGIADTLQTSIAAMNSDAFIGVMCIVLLCCCELYWFYGFIMYLLFLFVHECNNKNEETRGSFNDLNGETAQFSTCGNGCPGICGTPCGICGPWLSCTCGLIFGRSCRCSNDERPCGRLPNGDGSLFMGLCNDYVMIV